MLVLVYISAAEGGFPIDIRSVQSDHEFLGSDSLRALYRRLNTLNRCAIMRIDQVILRRRNDDLGYGMYEPFDDDDSALNWPQQLLKKIYRYHYNTIYVLAPPSILRIPDNSVRSRLP
ncbi:unnamed protein product [Nippostrongylus brasiliensis]|uniref:Uncharacterized protein n=1 Tax=Nippostrongylus brasiliensis TaxID=27835 RepID=A0A0N4YBQ2_NIPBR|nr:unnamed protein product [Nippostrongylus brasiliensis]